MIPVRDILESVFKELTMYACPNNLDGFFMTFCHWTLKEWNERPYYRTEIADFGPDLSEYPRRTGFTLKEKAHSYCEFIHSYNGKTHAPFFGDNDTSERMEKNLYDFFHESMRLHALSHIKAYWPAVDADALWSRIFCEDFEEAEERLLAEEIALHFGFYALAAEPYTCHAPRSQHRKGRFATWTQDDFRMALRFVERTQLEAIS